MKTAAIPSLHCIRPDGIEETAVRGLSAGTSPDLYPHIRKLHTVELVHHKWLVCLRTDKLCCASDEFIVGQCRGPWCPDE